MKEVLIRLEKVNKKFGKNEVLKDLDFSIKKEGITGIVGLSGCGKTTLLNLIIGFLKPTKGKILYNFPDIKKAKHIKEQFGFATQEGSIYPFLTVQENLAYFGLMHNIPKQELKKRIDYVLELVDLESYKNFLASELSTGMYRRLDTACSLIHQPKVIMFDEPTSNLDPVLRKRLLGMIKQISDSGTKVILTSHLLSEVEKICDTLAILHNGKIIEEGRPDELKDRYSKNQLITLRTKSAEYEPIVAMARRYQAKNIVKKDKYLYIYTKEPERLLYNILYLLRRKNDPILEAEVSKPSIEEVFEVTTK